MNTVAPLAGAWIETSLSLIAFASTGVSHPSRVRGLKLSYLRAGLLYQRVAPLAGAWIETL